MPQFIKDGTVKLTNKVSVLSCGSAVGKMEGEGPLGECFDYVSKGAELGEETWEKAESKFQQYAFDFALRKGNFLSDDIDFIFAGDLLNQCTGSTYGLRQYDLPFLGLYGACSTMAESLAVASLFADSGIGEYCAAVTSSHFCSAERQFRFPINYGGVRTPTAQWTATASGCCIVGKSTEPPFINAVTIGKIVDMGEKDANNMGAAMAGAAYDSISRHLSNTGKRVSDYDAIFTGDLGQVGTDILVELFSKQGTDISTVHKDCGLMLFDREKQDVHAGGSGCGCSASVLCGYILPRVKSGELKNILFAATGALMSTTVSQQGESIPGISHVVEISHRK
ncbi:MAG: stage V sporulation protein AD [Ruminiclostridium sp.]|nr:stage V sporulation protein AD [Ruminiclostridium sp.]